MVIYRCIHAANNARTFFRREYYHQNYGNVLQVPLYGMGLPEKEQVDYYDPHYQVIITVKAIK
jgi:hypothetical protein